MEVSNYITEDGKEPFAEWIKKLRDGQTRTRILKNIAKMRLGNFGDSESVGEGVSELKLDFGAGYRVYYAKHGKKVVFLLCGGDKDTQQKDIEKARDYWAEYKARMDKGK